MPSRNSTRCSYALMSIKLLRHFLARQGFRKLMPYVSTENVKKSIRLERFGAPQLDVRAESGPRARSTRRVRYLGTRDVAHAALAPHVKTPKMLSYASCRTVRRKINFGDIVHRMRPECLDQIVTSAQVLIGVVALKMYCTGF